MKGLFVVQFMLLHLLLDYSEGYTTGQEKGNFSYCLKKVNETDREGEKEVTQMPPLLTQEIIAKWNTLNDTYRTINCTDDNDCPKNCTCFRHGMKSYYCAHVYREEGGI
ncbi:hypothetical protein MTO96_017815 [Rhipicephalus appendiculatus]